MKQQIISSICRYLEEKSYRPAYTYNKFKKETGDPIITTATVGNKLIMFDHTTITVADVIQSEKDGKVYRPADIIEYADPELFDKVVAAIT